MSNKATKKDARRVRDAKPHCCSIQMFFSTSWICFTHCVERWCKREGELKEKGQEKVTEWVKLSQLHSYKNQESWNKKLSRILNMVHFHFSIVIIVWFKKFNSKMSLKLALKLT